MDPQVPYTPTYNTPSRSWCPSEDCPTKTSGWVWFALVVAIVALILVVIIYILFFIDRGDFNNVFDPVWGITSVDNNNKVIAGENFTLYVASGGAGVAQGDSITLNTPSGGSKPGQWFIVTNTNDKPITVNAGTGVTFQQFPFKSDNNTQAVPTAPNTSSSLIPGKTSWVIAWSDANGTALNLIPGGIALN
jgi:flagellar basal body-associated protein FliL